MLWITYVYVCICIYICIIYIYIYLYIYIYGSIFVYIFDIYIYIYIHTYIYITFVHIYNIIGQLLSRVKSQLFFTCSRPYLAPPFRQFGLHPSPIGGTFV